MSADVDAAIVDARAVCILRPGVGDRVREVVGALADAGVRFAEMSMASPAGTKVLESLMAHSSERLVLGAGTVRTVVDAELAVAAGARFLVSPGVDPAVIDWAAARGVTHLPGVFTATELECALRAGASLVKLFPAGRMGAGYVSDLLVPFPHARLVPTGGIDAANAAEFLKAGAVAVAVGSGVAAAGLPPEVVRDRARELVAAVQTPTPSEV